MSAALYIRNLRTRSEVNEVRFRFRDREKYVIITKGKIVRRRLKVYDHVS